MKIPLLLIGFFSLFQTTCAQTGSPNIYNPAPLLIHKKAIQTRDKHGLPVCLADTIFCKASPIFSKYVPGKRPFQSIAMTNNALGAKLPVGSNFSLEQSRNRAKLLFYKMKMWQYFK